ncbi:MULTISPECIES: low molecular weight phosphatase family protein [unclassified Knoellia]|uniref:arsenate-mycothiol transferase ArsC n=1 Tax=Knoellia altitudinis TaxID=3404795 RepID=UPI003618FC63
MRPRPERVDEPLRVLFVCTANISRSPYAERMAAHLATHDEAPLVRFASAGVPGFPGRGMDPEMSAQLRGRGVEPNGHVSRSVSTADLAEADVVVTVELAHRWRIAEGWPEHAPKVFGLNQLADALDRSAPSAGGLEALDGALAVARPDSLSWDVADPYRRGTAAARLCAVEIDEALSVIVPALTGVPVPR